MSFAQMGWQEISVFAVGGILILAGCIAFIAGLVHEDKQHKRDLAKFDARVGRDVFRDTRGTHK